MTTPSTTLTAAREAERAAHEAAAAATKHREQVEKEVEQERPTVQWRESTYRYRLGSLWIERKQNDGRWRDEVNADYIALLASLLPRKPVEVTDDMLHTVASLLKQQAEIDAPWMRVARIVLEAVASDLSAPVAVAAPTLGEPERWGVFDNRDRCYTYLSESAAKAQAATWDLSHPNDGPHRVYALHRVPDETEGAANG